jgi:homoserine dehydrogenase
MNTQKGLRIGLFGFGVVGEGIYQVLLQTPSLNAEIRKVCIRHPEKKRNAPAELFTTRYEDILEDENINLVVELIDDAEEAYRIVTTALRNRKSVVSANKKLIGNHLPELIRLQKENGVSFLYEAAVCGSIPVIRNLEEYYDNDLLQSICGIVNGSTNYILTRIAEEGLSYREALQEAQQLGFAESNPALDVEGTDAANKLSILLLHAYGILAHPDGLLYKGITALNAFDSVYAREKNYKVKLTAQAKKLSSGRIAAFVLPCFVSRDSQLFSVQNEYNGVIIESKLADKQFLYGKGAGRFPTSSAVVSDISALRYGYKYEYKKLHREGAATLASQFYLHVYVSFEEWTDINKWDFEQVYEFHSTGERQYLTGLIHIDRLRNAPWLSNPSVSLILLPEGIVESSEVIQSSIRKISLQLAGVS